VLEFDRVRRHKDIALLDNDLRFARILCFGAVDGGIIVHVKISHLTQTKQFPSRLEKRLYYRYEFRCCLLN
jgi:hypothetical protein